jgi:hypothetical protein
LFDFSSKKYLAVVMKLIAFKRIFAKSALLPFIIGFFTRSYLMLVQQKLRRARLVQHTEVTKQAELKVQGLFDMITESDDDSDSE